MERIRPLNPHFRLFLAVSLSSLGVLLMAGRSSAPASAHSDAAKHGAELFATSGCTHCHGPEGTGTDRGPALRDLRKHLSAEEIEHQIVAGGKAMPAFGDTLGKEQIADLVAFLRAKKWVAAPPQAEPAPTP